MHGWTPFSKDLSLQIVCHDLNLLISLVLGYLQYLSGNKLNSKVDIHKNLQIHFYTRLNHSLCDIQPCMVYNVVYIDVL